MKIVFPAEMVSFLDLILEAKTMPAVLSCGLCLRIIGSVFKLEMELALVTVLLVGATACKSNRGGIKGRMVLLVLYVS